MATLSPLCLRTSVVPVPPLAMPPTFHTYLLELHGWMGTRDGIAARGLEG